MAEKHVAPTALGEGDELEALEIELLLEAVYRRYGCDYREYALASLRRRIRQCVEDEGLGTVSALQDRLLHDRAAMTRFLGQITVSVTAMFRDPPFYVALRERVVPLLRSYPFVRIWHAGCATGEEVYSAAIVLMEEGLYERCRIYATDIDEAALVQARDGIFSLSRMQEYSRNYQLAGGKATLSDYFTASYDHVIFRQALKKNLIVSHHNLVTDGSFNEFHVVFCRNVLIYFNPSLQARVHQLIFDSLRRFGVLGLGASETLRGTPHEQAFEALDATQNLYRKLSG